MIIARAKPVTRGAAFGGKKSDAIEWARLLFLVCGLGNNESKSRMTSFNDVRKTLALQESTEEDRAGAYSKLTR